MQVTGKITKILEVVKGQKKDGSGEWEKLTFVLDNNEQYNNIFAFEIFGKDKVENFNKYQKVGQTVTVDFNVNTNEWTSPQGELKFFTTLQAWKVFKAEQQPATIEQAFEPAANLNTEDKDDLPF